MYFGKCFVMLIHSKNEFQHVLQRPVAEHDPVEGERSGDGILLHELHKGKACRLGFVACHANKLDIAHLLEELQQLLGSGGLGRCSRGRGDEAELVAGCVGGLKVATYLRVEVADVHGPPDLINFGGVNVAHEWRLSRN